MAYKCRVRSCVFSFLIEVFSVTPEFHCAARDVLADIPTPGPFDPPTCGPTIGPARPGNAELVSLGPPASLVGPIECSPRKRTVSLCDHCYFVSANTGLIVSRKRARKPSGRSLTTLLIAKSLQLDISSFIRRAFFTGGIF